VSVPLFLEFARSFGLEIKPERSGRPTATAMEAAEAHGVPASNIIKSLVVRAGSEFLICLCPGDKRLDLKKLGESLGNECVRMATAEEVKKVTGHSIGGVPPFGHKRPLRTIIFPGFNPKQPLWAAAGSSEVNFRITLSALKRVVRMVNWMVG